MSRSELHSLAVIVMAHAIINRQMGMPEPAQVAQKAKQYADALFPLQSNPTSATMAAKGVVNATTNSLQNRSY